MPGDSGDYARHFQTGARVRVGIPSPDRGAFQEWGTVLSLYGDLLELHLSRDYLPETAQLELGRTLELGVLDRAEKLCCRGMIAGHAERRLTLRLVGGFSRFEPREFFRQDVYLPLVYRVPPRQRRREIAERWRQTRWAMEFACQQQGPGETPEMEALREEIRSRIDRCKGVAPIPANMSGGGVRLIIGESLRPGMLVELAIYLPQPQRVIEVVGEVVQVRPLAQEGRFSTALRFRFIDEADRDRLIACVTAEQLRQLSQQSPWQPQPAGPSLPARVRPLRLAIALLVLAILLGYQARAIVASRERGEKHEIAAIFEKGIQQILRQR